MLKLKAPENCGTHVSFDGELYEVKNGIVELPNSATELLNHGFTRAPEGDDGEDEQPKRGGRPRRQPDTEDGGAEG